MNQRRSDAAAPVEEQIIASWTRNVVAPVVSVLCHTYNHADYLRAALDSILSQQTDFPFEIILRDDGSTDATPQIVRTYAARYPRIIRSLLETENCYRRGVKPIAATFPLAHGEFIAFCEGDDYWLGSGKLQQQVEFMRAYAGCGLVHGNYLNLLRIGGGWRIRVAFRSKRLLQQRSGNIYPAMLQANRIQTCTVLCRRNLMADYRRSGPGVDTYVVGDWPLFLYLAHESIIGFIDQPLAAYRRTPGSITNAGEAAAVARGLDAIRMGREFCDFFRDNDKIAQATLIAQHRTLMWLAFRAGDRQHFDQAWIWLAKNHPALLKSARVRTMRMIIDRKWALATTQRGLAAIVRAKHRLEFRVNHDGQIE